MSPADVGGQISGALCWSAFFSLAAVDILLGTAPLWVSFLIYRDVRRGCRFGFWPLLHLRYTLIVAIVRISLFIPQGHRDGERIGGLSNSVTTLGTLADVSRFIIDPRDESNSVTLPSRNPTLRETMQAIEAQTGRRCDPRGSCMSGILRIDPNSTLFILVEMRNPKGGTSYDRRLPSRNGTAILCGH